MKIEFKRPILMDFLEQLRLIARKTSLAVTETFLIETLESGIRITASNQESELAVVFSAEIIEAGAVCVNAKQFFEIIKEFPDDDITFEQVELQKSENEISEKEEGIIRIANDSVKYQLPIIDAADFPEVRNMENIKEVAIDYKKLRSFLQIAMIAGGGGSDIRLYILGILLKKAGEFLEVVSTTGGILIACKEEMELADDFEILVSKAEIPDVIKFLDAEVTIGFDERFFCLRKANAVLSIRLLDSRFPQYKEVLNKFDGQKRVLLNKEEFLKVLKRIAIMISPDAQGADFLFEDGSLTISTINPNLGEATEKIAIVYEGKLTAFFNPLLFISVIKAISADNIELGLLNSESPCLISGEDTEQVKGIIMPMNK